MKITLFVDGQIFVRAREKLRATGKSINDKIREHLARIGGDEDIERELEEFVRRSCQGNSEGWNWNREDVYEGRLRWPRKGAR
jgi:hypothetical protein